MRHRLGHAVEHQSDADASREEHRAPCSEREIRLRIVGSKLDPAVAAEGKDQDRDEEDDDGPDIEPPERIQHPALYVLEEFTGVVWPKPAVDQHHSHDDECAYRHSPANLPSHARCTTATVRTT